MRWLDPYGNVWASRFEYAVYEALRAHEHNIRRCTVEDSMAYVSAVTGGRCADCGGSNVLTDRRYTPDFRVVPSGAIGEVHYFIEAKGYLRAERRALLRAFRKARPDVDLRFLVQRDYRVTSKTTITQWVTKYMKCPVAVWTGNLPKDWV
jgi:hypothetical protein